jgi:hypothetical protein
VNPLLTRLDAIGESLARSGHALALLGLGSVGVETQRLDAYSDLDFFAIVEPGRKQRYLADLDWLRAIHPIAYAFMNTADGYKLLYADGIFCEFAVFAPEELSAIPFTGGRVVWRRADVAAPWTPPAPTPAEKASRDVEWLLGEALTNLYVGLGRDLRGETLAAMRLIQTHAVDRVLELLEHLTAAQPAPRDPFAIERRFEQRYPTFAAQAALWMQGYDRNRESARAILAFLEQHVPVNAALAAAIRERLG